MCLCYMLYCLQVTSQYWQASGELTMVALVCVRAGKEMVLCASAHWVPGHGLWMIQKSVKCFVQLRSESKQLRYLRWATVCNYCHLSLHPIVAFCFLLLLNGILTAMISLSSIKSSATFWWLTALQPEICFQCGIYPSAKSQEPLTRGC